MSSESSTHLSTGIRRSAWLCGIWKSGQSGCRNLPGDTEGVTPGKLYRNALVPAVGVVEIGHVIGGIGLEVNSRACLKSESALRSEFSRLVYPDPCQGMVERRKGKALNIHA